MSVSIWSPEAPEDIDSYGFNRNEVNMSNRNAAIVFRALGIDLEATGWYGNEPAVLFALRCERALANPAVLHHEGIADRDLSGRSASEIAAVDPLLTAFAGSGCRILSTGIAPGYLSERITQLLGIARQSGAVTITWS